jgi:hypothetical protein
MIERIDWASSHLVDTNFIASPTQPFYRNRLGMFACLIFAGAMCLSTRANAVVVTASDPNYQGVITDFAHSGSIDIASQLSGPLCDYQAMSGTVTFTFADLAAPTLAAPTITQYLYGNSTAGTDICTWFGCHGVIYDNYYRDHIDNYMQPQAAAMVSLASGNTTSNAIGTYLPGVWQYTSRVQD